MDAFAGRPCGVRNRRGRNDRFMQTRTRTEKAREWMPLLLLYAGCVCVRYILAILTSYFPTVYIDEFLYYSLGRSIATEGSLLFYGQPAIYNYLAYPLVLSPVYRLFGAGTDYYRVIQLWNILLMSLSVFPVFCLCREMFSDRKKALVLTGMIMLLPNFLLGQYIHSEAIIYPLFYMLMLCLYRNQKENSVRNLLWAGIIGGLLYSAKPGAVLPAALALLLFAAKAVREKSRKGGLAVLAGAAGFAAVFLVMKLLAEQAFGYGGTLFSIYDAQIVSEPGDPSRVFPAVLRYPYYFLMAGGILPLAVSLRRYPEFGRRERRYYLFIAVCSLLTMLGCAWFINRMEEKTILYLRYVEMYLPLLCLFVFIPAQERPDAPAYTRTVSRILCLAVPVYTAVATLVWGCTTGIGDIHDTHFQITLSMLYMPNLTVYIKYLLLLLSAGTLCLLALKTDRKKLTAACAAVILVFALANNVFGYSVVAGNFSRALEKETDAVHEAIGDTEYLHVCADNQCDNGLDIRSRHNIIRITARDFYACIQRNRGYYVPFVPQSSRGMTSVYKTPETDTVILDTNVYQALRYSNLVQARLSPESNFLTVKFDRNQRFADCLITFDHYPDIQTGKTYYLQIFNEELIHVPIMIHLEIETDVDQDLEFVTPAPHKLALHKGRNLYEISVDDSVSEYSFVVRNQGIRILSYEIVPMNQEQVSEQQAQDGNGEETQEGGEQGAVGG